MVRQAVAVDSAKVQAAKVVVDSVKMQVVVDLVRVVAAADLVKAVVDLVRGAACAVLMEVVRVSVVVEGADVERRAAEWLSGGEWESGRARTELYVSV